MSLNLITKAQTLTLAPLQVVLSSEAAGGVSGNVLAQQIADNGDRATYRLNVTLEGPVILTHGKYILEVLEFWDGPYNPLAVTRTAINVVV
jgi:hypothetical protein